MGVLSIADQLLSVHVYMWRPDEGDEHPLYIEAISGNVGLLSKRFRSGLVTGVRVDDGLLNKETMTKSLSCALRPPWPHTWFETRRENAQLGVEICQLHPDEARVCGPRGSEGHPLLQMVVMVGDLTNRDRRRPRVLVAGVSYISLHSDSWTLRDERTALMPGIRAMPEEPQAREWIDYGWVFGCVCLGLLNVKNVKTEDIPFKNKKQRRVDRRGVATRFQFKRLVVRPGSLAAAQASTGTPAGSSNLPLHIVRGHLADYTKGNGLFGKHKGIFWVPAHKRGDRSVGSIKKGYDLCPPKSEESDDRQE